jgi:hypothetical protein
MVSKPECLTVSVNMAAAMLGLSRNAAYQGCQNGQIPCLRIGKRLLVPKIQLTRMLNGEVKANG